MEILSRRPELPTDKRRAVEADVLQATETLLEEGASFASLSIERIATRAGISRTAFYFYFADKRELLMRLAADVAEQFYREAGTWWSGSGDGAAATTAPEGGVGLVTATARTARDGGAGAAAVTQPAAAMPDRSEPVMIARWARGARGRCVGVTGRSVERRMVERIPRG